MTVYERETCGSSYSIFYLACRLHMHPLLFTVSDKFLNAPYIHVCMHAGYLISNCVSVKNYSFSLWIVSSLDLLEGTGKRLFTPNVVHVTNVGCMARTCNYSNPRKTFCHETKHWIWQITYKLHVCLHEHHLQRSTKENISPNRSPVLTFK